MDYDAGWRIVEDAGAQVPLDREMDTPRWREPGDPQLYEAIAQIWAFRRTFPRRFPPGVRRYRTIEELDQQVEAWNAADATAQAAGRSMAPPSGAAGANGPARPPRRTS